MHLYLISWSAASSFVPATNVNTGCILSTSLADLQHTNEISSAQQTKSSRSQKSSLPGDARGRLDLVARQHPHAHTLWHRMN
jgi:hypothetical protein